MNLTAYEWLALGRLTLEVGSTAESVTVTAKGMMVETQSQERGTVLNQEQVAGLMTTSRRFMDMLKGLPGTSYSGGIPNVNGLPSNTTDMIGDRSPTQELGSSGSASTRAHIDSIGEVKILTSNCQAEYGGAGGAVVQVVTKGGTNRFRRSTGWYRQNESFNANDYGAPFGGNVIPTDRINPNGPKLLTVFPAPNIVDRNITLGQYNWTFIEPGKNSRDRLDYGMRFSYHVPYNQGSGRISNFTRGAWQAAKAPMLYQPVLGPTGARSAQNPFTGELHPAVLIGALVPGSGDFANGMVLGTEAGVPKGFMENQGILFGPRFGLSWDVFGDGKTAIRTGGAIFYQVAQIAADQTVFIGNPPIQYSPITYYGNMATLQQSAGVMFPSTVRGWDMTGEIPTVYNYSFGIQRNIGFSTVLDVAYVGNKARHLAMNTALNTLPYGARFLPESQDPTRPGKPLPDAFLAPHAGYSNVTVYSRDGNSNYNSLQVQANRRFARSLQFGVALPRWGASAHLAHA